MELTAIFRLFAQAAGPAAVTGLWQGAVMALGLGISLRLASRVPAADRFRVWAAGFAALVALPLLPLIGLLHFGPLNAIPIAVNSAPAHVWLDLDPRLGLLIAGAWLVASVWRAVDLAAHGIVLRGVWKRAIPIELSEAPVPVCSTRDLDRPSVIGFFRPRILVPEWLLARLTPVELKQVVLHEAEHLRRRDDWTNLLQKLALVVFPLNPALAWIERQLCHEREMACDDAVVRSTGKPRAYAACLASLAERGLQYRREALSLGAWRKRPELACRVHRLLKSAPGLHPAATRMVLLLVGGGLAFGSMEFARAPQLVAFVAPVIAQSNTPDLVISGVRPMAGYRAVNAVAEMPSRAETAEGAGSRKWFPALAEKLRKDGARAISPQAKVAPPDSGAGLVQTASEQPPASAGTHAREPQPQQWIVMTTYEQVVTIPRSARRNAGSTADYDVSPATDGEATGAVADSVNDANSGVVRQWTVTQLIFRVDSAKSAAQNATQNAGGTEKASRPEQPAAGVPHPAAALQPAPSVWLNPALLHDGWLVLQL